MPLRKKGKEDLHLLAALLDVSNVIEDDGIESVELLQSRLELESPFGYEQSLDELEGRDEKYAETWCSVNLINQDQWSPE